jgi:hypothetical protein
MKAKYICELPYDNLWVIRLTDPKGAWHHLDFPSKKKAIGAVRYFKRHYKGKQYREKYLGHYVGVL